MTADAGTFRAPRQRRSRLTADRIAIATESLLAERGPDGVTVQDIVARADTSVGAFYARFGNKAGAVTYVRERFWDETRALWSDFLDPARWSGIDAVTLSAEVVRRSSRVFLADAGRTRAFVLELLGRPDGSGRRRIRELDADIGARMGRLMWLRADELRHPRPAEAGDEGFRRVLGAMRDHLLVRPDETASAAGETRALILTLTRMYARFLGAARVPDSYGELLRRCRVAHERPVS